MFQLLRLAGLLDALPLPPGSAQAEMVAAGLSQRATLPEREARALIQLGLSDCWGEKR